jgi:hypothetical protein
MDDLVWHFVQKDSEMSIQQCSLNPDFSMQTDIEKTEKQNYSKKSFVMSQNPKPLLSFVEQSLKN